MAACINARKQLKQPHPIVRQFPSNKLFRRYKALSNVMYSKLEFIVDCGSLSVHYISVFRKIRIAPTSSVAMSDVYKYKLVRIDLLSRCITIYPYRLWYCRIFSIPLGLTKLLSLFLNITRVISNPTTFAFKD